MEFYHRFVPEQENHHIIRVAILDLYNNEPNEGMRGIQTILNQQDIPAPFQLRWERFDVRFKEEIPDDSFDIYISSGGPGSPLEEPGARWEIEYFKLIDKLWEHNKSDDASKKFIFFICHSFQLMCRHLDLADVVKRHSTAFGIFPVHKTEEGQTEKCFAKLPDPFFAVDSRDWQVIQPNDEQMAKIGAKLLAIEKDRPHVPYERAVMSIRFSPEMIGTQCHPEADPVGMLHYLLRTDKKDIVVKHHGQEKYDEMLLHLNDPDKINLTQSSLIPAFLEDAIRKIVQQVKVNA
ncbi:MAG: GMP synthase [Bacteroidia bacterium]|nr:GMP synthase [Bacteroidia bacterium]